MRREQAALGELIGRTLDHPSMPVAVRLEVPDWMLPKPGGPVRGRRWARS